MIKVLLMNWNDLFRKEDPLKQYKEPINVSASVNIGEGFRSCCGSKILQEHSVPFQQTSIQGPRVEPQLQHHPSNEDDRSVIIVFNYGTITAEAKG